MNNKFSRLSDIYNNIHNFSNRYKNIKELLGDLTRLAEEIKIIKDWDYISISRCLYGLNGMNAIPEVQAILNSFATKILKIGQLDSQAVGCALYRLQKMDASSNAVQNILKALEKKISEMDVPILTEHIRAALYGLQRMDALS